MNILFVVSQLEDWQFAIPGITPVASHAYLVDPVYGEMNGTQVFNLCTTYRYQSHGYYVSLLAEARGHQPLPGVEAIKDLQSGELSRDIRETIVAQACSSLSQVADDHVDLRIYFGRSPDGAHAHLCMALFRLLKAPVLRVCFEKATGDWRLDSVQACNITDIPEQERTFFADAVTAWLQQERIRNHRAPGEPPRIAILHDPEATEAPSNPPALMKFCEAARMLGMRASLITKNDASRLFGYDALFIRATTNVNHYTYQISRQAMAAGLVVIDDPDSILRCNNKIFLAELMNRHHVPMPKTLIVNRENQDRIVSTLGLPCILKQPDGAFSAGVAKVHTEEALMAKMDELFRESELILAQEYLPTDFDWRIGVLDHRPLFACKYYMAPGHWQIIKHEHDGIREGRTEALSIGEVPNEVTDMAVRAAELIGDGFYGVDLKQVGSHLYLIEINDNPNVDCGNEDGVLGDALYREVMGVLLKRVEAMKGTAPS